MAYALLNALQQLLSDGFANIQFRKNDEAEEQYVEPNFFIGALPSRRKHNAPSYEGEWYYPFIVNRFTGGSDSDDQSLFTVQTVCGIYTPDGEAAGLNDIGRMVLCARELMLKQRILDRFSLQPPLTWTLGDNESGAQSNPFFVGQIRSTWRAPAIEQQLSVEDRARVFSDGY